MRTIFFIIRKEFRQVSRNSLMIRIIIALPIVQMLILVNAATMEMKNINIAIVDFDKSNISRDLSGKFEHSPFFTLVYQGFSEDEAMDLVVKNKADLIMKIPSGFQKNLLKNNTGDIQFLINAINGMTAGITNAYAQFILLDFNKQIIADWGNFTPDLRKIETIEVTYQHWFNQELRFSIFMVPGILVILITMMGMLLSGLNLVREKEMGTIEQINVTPIKKYQFIMGKLIPFFVIGLVELTLGLAIGVPLFSVPVVGSYFVLYGVAAIYLFAVMGIGLLLSTMASTQQQLMFIAFFFVLVFILMSGIFTPTDSMPFWAHKINTINPIMYFMRAIRMIVLKGSGFSDLIFEMRSLFIYGLIAFSLAVYRYKKTV